MKKLLAAGIIAACSCHLAFAQDNQQSPQQRDLNQSQSQSSSSLQSGSQTSQSIGQSSQPSSQSPDINRNQALQSSQSGSQINEPAGAEPLGRAFSSTNPPPGKPFEQNREGQGRPFPDSGSKINEPSGAAIQGQSTQSGLSGQTGQTGQSSQTDQTSQSGQSQPAQSAQPESQSGQSGQSQAGQSSQAELHQGQAGYAAGAQNQNSQQLRTALTQFKAQGTVSADQKTQLQQAIHASLRHGQNLPEDFSTRLAGDLSVTLTKVQLDESVRVKLANDIGIILDAGPGAQVQVEAALGDVRHILVVSGQPLPEARAVVCDLHLIASELVPGAVIPSPQ